ncbi:hypothetical protein DID77_02925 [Candidatus Marinamargulisbacteria bacterium SCGC AG-439-L15]|nr:hypothetical protein DID77_02925 [Candidatus Marinamargulisbacteria bacterium SCGC AG-439-L15]
MPTVDPSGGGVGGVGGVGNSDQTAQDAHSVAKGKAAAANALSVGSSAAGPAKVSGKGLSADMNAAAAAMEHPTRSDSPGSVDTDSDDGSIRSGSPAIDLGVGPVASSSDIDPVWNDILGSESTKVYSESETETKEIIRSVLETGLSQGQKVVVINSDYDLQTLMTSAKLEDGGISQVDGPLKEVLENGGVICINYGAISPKYHLQTYGLLDESREFEGVNAHKDVKVVGILDDNQIRLDSAVPKEEKLSPSLLSRFKGHISPTDTSVGELDRQEITSQEDLKDYEVYDCKGRFDMASMVGTLGVGDSGFVLKEGALIKALNPANNKKGIVFKRPPKNDFGFEIFLRTIQSERKITLNGETHDLPDGFTFRFLDENLEAGLTPAITHNSEKHRFEPASDSPPGTPLEVINKSTKDRYLHGEQYCKDGFMYDKPAILSDHPEPLNIHITTQLSDSDWEALFTLCEDKAVTFYLDPLITVPKRFSSEGREISQQGKSRPPITAWEPGEPLTSGESYVIQTEDMAMATKTIVGKSSRAQYEIVDLTDHDFSELFLDLDIDLKGDKKFTAKETALVQTRFFY